MSESIDGTNLHGPLARGDDLNEWPDQQWGAGANGRSPSSARFEVIGNDQEVSDGLVCIGARPGRLIAIRHHVKRRCGPQHCEGNAVRPVTNVESGE